MTRTAQIALLVKSTRRASKTEVEVLALGYSQAEIDAAVASGAVRRIGSQMGLTTIRTLSV